MRKRKGYEIKTRPGWVGTNRGKDAPFEVNKVGCENRVVVVAAGKAVEVICISVLVVVVTDMVSGNVFG